MKQARKVLLFLDIDGILHSTEKELVGCDYQTEQLRVDIVKGKLNPATLGLLDISRQQLLAHVLNRHPDVRIVISSAWRSWEGYNFLNPADLPDPDFEERHVKTLKWLKAWLLPAITDRVIGATPQLDSRLEEIEEAAATLDCDAWVALDDQIGHFPADDIAPYYQEAGSSKRYDTSVPRDRLAVIINGEQGLCATSAKALDAALRYASRAVRQKRSLARGKGCAAAVRAY